MQGLNELIIKKQRYVQFPELISQFTKESDQVEKLSLHFCQSSSFTITVQDWPNLRFLEIIGCKTLDLQISARFGYSNAPSQLEQIYIANSDNLNINGISGDFPGLWKLKCENCKYIKFKGEIDGNIGLEVLEFDKSLRTELFLKSAYLPDLHLLIFKNGSHFSKINLTPLKAPALETIWFENSNYLNIISLGSLENQLKSFKFENCAYPKLNVDFSKLIRIQQQSQGSSSPESNLEPQESPFRKVKPVIKSRTSKSRDGHLYNVRKDPAMNADLELYRTALSEGDARNSAQEFLDSIKSSEDKPSIEVSFCPNCGAKIRAGTRFCNHCGAEIQKR
ncbi:MAG: zinc ribbon domain-containing protein [Promethearchaeota archaeon]